MAQDKEPHVHGPGCSHDHEPHVHVPQEPIVKEKRPGRNEACWCGSGTKYKKCHLNEDQA